MGYQIGFARIRACHLAGASAQYVALTELGKHLSRLARTGTSGQDDPGLERRLEVLQRATERLLREAVLT